MNVFVVHTKEIIVEREIRSRQNQVIERKVSKGAEEKKLSDYREKKKNEQR